jgi:8-oxo-dGTP pyrophosphatase MutT (NUDIX family)
MPSPVAANADVLPTDLVKHLNHVLLDLHQHPYPDVPSPSGVPKRASVALVIRIQPHYKHWPAISTGSEEVQYSSVEDRINAFFHQDWVQHGDPEVLFIKRAARKGDKWDGHVALPGGRRDPPDADDRAAAVREAWEEVGIDLSEHQAIATGNLPQRIVTTSWGKTASDARSFGLMKLTNDGLRLMTLCPYVFLLTAHEIPPLRLQPTEVASTHWVPLRALLSPKQRTYWCQDVSNRTSRRELGLTRIFHRSMLGDMMFAAVRLIPSESKYCSSIAEFLPEQSLSHDGDNLNNTVPMFSWSWNKAKAPVDNPLLLWGLTLGVIGDFLDMLPPHNAFKIWTYPTFTPLDVRFTLWLLSYSFRRRKQMELEEDKKGFPAVEPGLEAVPEDGEPGHGRVEGMGLGRYYGRVRQDQRGSRSSAVNLLLGGYYEIVRTAVAVSLCTRVSVASVILYYMFKGLKPSR